MNKFGPNGRRAEIFLDEVRDATQETWRRYVDLPRPPREERKEARDGVGGARIPASISAAIGKESIDAFRRTGLHTDSFPGKEARSMAVSAEIELACTVIVAGEKVADAHARTMLQPFADVGFAAAAAELRERSAPHRPVDSAPAEKPVP